MMARIEPVEQGRARAADMEEAGGRGREAGDDLGLRSRAISPTMRAMATRDASAPSIGGRGRHQGATACRAHSPRLSRFSARSGSASLRGGARRSCRSGSRSACILGIGACFYLPDWPAWTAFLLLAAAAALAGARARRRDALGQGAGPVQPRRRARLRPVWWQAERAAAPRLAREQLMEFNATHRKRPGDGRAGARSASSSARSARACRCACASMSTEDKAVPGLEPGATVAPARLDDAAGADGGARRL